MNEDSLANLSYFLRVSWEMGREAGGAVLSPEGLANPVVDTIQLGRLAVPVLKSGTRSAFLVGVDVIPSSL